MFSHRLGVFPLALPAPSFLQTSGGGNSPGPPAGQLICFCTVQGRWGSVGGLATGQSCRCPPCVGSVCCPLAVSVCALNRNDPAAVSLCSVVCDNWYHAHGMHSASAGLHWPLGSVCAACGVPLSPVWGQCFTLSVCAHFRDVCPIVGVIAPLPSLSLVTSVVCALLLSSEAAPLRRIGCVTRIKGQPLVKNQQYSVLSGSPW